MKATKIAAFVLMSIAALAVASSIGLALLSNVIPAMGTTASESTLGIRRVAQTFRGPIRVKGDPIDNPKPNTQ